MEFPGWLMVSEADLEKKLEKLILAWNTEPQRNAPYPKSVLSLLSKTAQYKCTLYTYDYYQKIENVFFYLGEVPGVYKVRQLGSSDRIFSIKDYGVRWEVSNLERFYG